MCPAIIAKNPFAKPSGTNNVPVKISAIDTAAPNHNNPLLNVDVL
jgi:hypothetical protein